MIDGIKPPRRQAQPGFRPIAHTQEVDDEPMFLPPEEVAARDEQNVEKAVDEILHSKSPKTAGKRRLHMPELSKKQWIIIAVVSFVVLSGGGVGAFALFHKKPAPVTPAVVKQEPPKVEEPPKPTTVASPLTGVQVQPTQAELPVTGIMIENSPDARPQSGLKDAGIVYEAIAEGGITRFLALFQESEADYIGPVRSARPYYVEWLQGYDASYAHVGGSPEALALIKDAGVKDLDQFYNSAAYQRISSRYAPHNVYTSIAKLRELQKAKGYTKSNFTGFARKAEKAVTPATASQIDLTLSGYLYNVHYDYDVATNSYKRSEGGKPHVDERSGAQLNPKVVVSIVVPYGIKSDGLHSDYQTTGSGKAFIFQDGTVTVGTWEKKGSKDPLRLGDANGSPLALNAGQTWVTAVGLEGSVAYKP